jgi:RNA polymerase sigma factor (sigma-70 family)
MDEVALIEKAQRGDVPAYNRLVLHYQELAFNVAVGIMKDPQTAEDMTQDAFVRAYKSLNKFRGGNFKAWLLRIVTNRCYDELRRHKRRPQTSIDEVTEDHEGVAFMASENEGPEAHQQRMELAAAVESCLDTLPEEQRLAAILCDIEDHDYNEMAEIMGVSLGTVKSRISRARSKLRDCLQGFAELLPASYRL